MKQRQYIGIILFLVAIIVGVYAVYYFFWWWKSDINQVVKTIKKEEKQSQNTVKENIEDNKDTKDTDSCNVAVINNTSAGNSCVNNWSWDNVIEGVKDEQNNIVDEQNIIVDDQNMIQLTADIQTWMQQKTSSNTQSITSWTKQSTSWDFNSSTGEELEYIEDIIPKELTIWWYVGYLLTWWKMFEVTKNIHNMLWYSWNTYVFSWQVNVLWLDTEDYDTEKSKLEEILSKRWWNMVELDLFWDKQAFINIEPYYKKIVIMLINKNWQNWLVTVSYDKYHKMKHFIKNLFN